MKSKTKIQPCDFYVVNAINVPKLSSDFIDTIGCVICDEVHLICAETLFKCMFYVHPRYMIGLSATPTRPDGLDYLIDLYFGEHKIIRPLFRPHKVYPIHTGIELDYELNWEGRMDWNSLLKSQTENVNRNELIVSIVTLYSDRNFLILCKRINQGEYLVRRLQEEKQDVTDLLGKNHIYNKDSRILVATTQKVGVGFSHNKLNTLLLASDMEEYFIQYLGRVFRTPDTEPIVFDIIDNNSVLKRHFSTRKKVYKKSGGVICKDIAIDTLINKLI